VDSKYTQRADTAWMRAIEHGTDGESVLCSAWVVSLIKYGLLSCMMNVMMLIT